MTSVEWVGEKPGGLEAGGSAMTAKRQTTIGGRVTEEWVFRWDPCEPYTT